MTTRRNFFQSAFAAAAVPASPQAQDERAYWVATLERLASPVLSHLAAGTLKREMPVESVTGNVADRRKYTHLEAFGRLLAGIAPWLEADLPASPERDLQQRYRTLARDAMRMATDPSSADFLNFHEGGQPLVDCGFLAQGILRAPGELWTKLDNGTKKNLAAALSAARVIQPPFNNWLLFAATVEAALATMGEPWDTMRIDYAIREHQQWYAGDGVYGDGPHFHFDYYNSYVIQPMLVDVLRAMRPHARTWESFAADTMARARRYAAIQERLIAPDGSFPPVGRSITYRCGAFHLLAQMALLGETATPEVRSALGAVIRRTLDAPGTFDRGWLTVGLSGHQPHLGEPYISTGSLYLCATALLPLGLLPSHNFWSGPAAGWSGKRLWFAEDMAADHALG